MQYPEVHVERGARFVEVGNLATAGGLTSGTDLAFRVVERYFGRDIANQTASMLNIRARAGSTRLPTPRLPDPSSKVRIILSAPSAAWRLIALSSFSSTYKGKTYYFCVREHKQILSHASPESSPLNRFSGSHKYVMSNVTQFIAARAQL